MTRRRSIRRRPRRRRPAGRARRSWPAAAGRRRRSARGGTGRRASGPRATADTNGARARSWRATTSSAAAGRHARVGVDEVEVGAVGDAVEQRVLARSARPGSSRCAAGSGRPRAATVRPGSTPSVVGAVLVAALEQQLQPEADARGTAGRRRSRPGSASTRPRRSRRAIAGAAAPTPGTTSASAPRSRLGVARDARPSAPTRASAPARCSRGCRRRSRRPRSAGAAASLIRASPSSRRRPSRRGSGSQAARSARASALNAASARWWSLRPVPRRWSVAPASARTTRARARRAGAAAPPTRSPRNGRSMTAYGRPPTSTTAVASDSSIGTLASPKRRMPARSPSASANAAPSTSATSSTVWCSSTCEVAVGRDREVEQAVVARTSPAGGRRSRSRSRSTVWPAPSRSSVTVTSVSRVVRATVTRRPSRGADRVARRAGSSCRRLRRPRPRGGLDQSVVLVGARGPSGAGGRRAGWPAGKVRGTSPRRSSPSATAAARSGEPKSTSRKFVTDGPTAQPSAGQRRRAGGRARARRARRWPSRAVGSSSASVTTVTDTVDTEPGGRNGFEPGDDLRARDAEPDPQAGQRVGLAGGPDDDEVRDSRSRRPTSDRSDELGVGLVEDDDRRRRGRRRRRRRRGRRAAPRSRRRVPAGRSGCSGCTARRAPASRGRGADGRRRRCA